MNNKEFYKIIREIFAKVDDYTNEDVSITNISELFIVKTYKSILEYGKRNSAEIIANEFYCIWALDSDTENELMIRMTMVFKFIQNQFRSKKVKN